MGDLQVMDGYTEIEINKIIKCSKIASQAIYFPWSLLFLEG